MQNLLAFLARHFHWLVFLLLETVSLILLFSFNSYQSSVWVSSANRLTGWAYKTQSNMEQFFSLTRRNEELTERNLFLEQQLRLLREKLAMGEAEAVTDSVMLSGQLTLIPAKVVRNSVDKTDNLITIDKGRADGVAPDMGVASGTGLVGMVYLAGEHYSVVIPVLNSRSRISCSIRGKGYFGYLTWNGGNPLEAYIEDVPRHAQFKKGDWVETSGYSSIFPPGVSVGKIIGIYNSSDGLSYRLKVHLSTDFACLRDVCVISDKDIAERMRLKMAIQDSIDINKLKH